MYDAFIIILVSTLAAIITEAASWYLIYRTADYQRLKKSIEQLQAKVDKLKASAPPSVLSASSSASRSSRPSKDVRRRKELDDELKKKQQLLTTSRFKSTLLTTLTLIGLFNLLSRAYYGQTVARLPFHPFPVVRGLSHRGIEGEDYTACSFAFCYALCQMSIRASITRALGFVPKDAGGLQSFMPTEEDDK